MWPLVVTDTLLRTLIDDLYEALIEQLGGNPDIFSIPGDERGAVGFGEAWVRTLDE